MLTAPLRSALAALGVIVCGLAGRAALDKVLAMRGGGELVAQWAQLYSLIELVAGPALAGVGTGVSVVVAQSADANVQRSALRHALCIGLLVSAAVGLAAMPLAWLAPSHAGWLGLGAIVGWLTVVHGTFSGYWLGLKRRGWMLLLALALAVAPLAAALVAPPAFLLPLVAAAHALPALALVPFVPRVALPPPQALRAYVLPGLSIGILSPASTYLARALVADALSWHDAGVLQALWRVSDWVAAIAAGVLSLFWLPRLSAAAGMAHFATELRRATLATALPSAAVLALLLAVHGPALALFYDARFSASSIAVALLFGGVAMRVRSWAGLFALYARRRTVAIAVGELLSLPLFALLVAAWPRPLTLEAVCGAWLLAFSAYAAFNLAAALAPGRERATA